MTNLELAKKYEEYIISMRRYFHENPELSGKEDGTVKRLTEELEKMGIEYDIVENGGILATVKPLPENDKGRTVLLRADIDALPVQETDEVLNGDKRKVKSKVDGVMHACGHDGHMAMLLGAAKILTEKKTELDGTVYLCFERGEEVSILYKNLFAYMDKHEIHPDSCYGMHLLSTLETGKLAINDTNMMAGWQPFEVILHGRGGHGSRPDQSVSPIDAFAAIYAGMEGIRLRKIDPYKTLTYSIGKLQSGLQGNVIPDDCVFAGTMRTFDRNGAGMVWYDEFKKLIEDTADAYGCTAEFVSYPLPGYAVINNPECAHFARKVIGAEIGADSVIDNAEPWMASESYARYLLQWPGVFGFLGMKNPDKGVGAAHHNRFFDIDEDVLIKGATAAATYALEFLKDGPDTSKMPKMTHVEILRSEECFDDLRNLYGIEE